MREVMRIARCLAWVSAGAVMACGRPVLAQFGDVMPPQTVTQPNQTYVAPPVIPGFDDHSASLTPPGGNTGQGFGKGPVRANRPPHHLLFLSGEVRAIGDRFLFAAPGLTYSDVDGYDLWIQPHFGASRGLSLGARYEFRRGGVPEAIRDVRADSFRLSRKVGDLTDEDRDAHVARRIEALDASNALTTRLRTSINLAFQRASSIHFEGRGGGGRQYGNRITAGLAVSQLYPVRRLEPQPVLDKARTGDKAALHRLGDSDGVFWAASVQGVSVNPDDGDVITGVRFGLRVGWQDAIPYASEVAIVGQRTPTFITRRWHFQTGVEFVSEDATTDGPIVSAFVRHRVEPSRKRRAKMNWDDLIRRSFEISLNGGLASSGHAFVALRFTKPFSF